MINEKLKKIKNAIAKKLGILENDDEAITGAELEKMTDEDGNPIDVAPHAQMKVRIYMDTPLEPYSMMRRECKPKED